MQPFSSDEFMKICGRLEGHHAIFYKLFEMGKPTFTSKVPTAAVTFDEGQNVGFIVNPKFWKTLTTHQKDFVVSHECLHVLLSHGMRMLDSNNPQACNIAMDVVVNELLVNKFGFSRKEIDPKNVYCWKDKIFPKGNVADEQTFEYYYNRLEKTAKGKGVGSGFGKTVDDHSGMAGGELPQDVIERLADSLSKEERNELQDVLKNSTEQIAGTAAGAMVKIMSGRAKPNRKWELLIRKWTKHYLGDNIQEQWLRMNRRMTMIEDAAILPSEMEDMDAQEKRWVKLFLFLDTSGSCESLVDKFWRAYTSIPKDRFEIHCFCFDTKVYTVDPKKKELYGFGGTSFNIIESKIQRMISKGEKYPDVVFVFTDGYGNSVKPEKPERWHWFLSPQSTRDCIPRESHTYSLAKFE